MQNTERGLKVQAHAKINLSLDIIGKRKDGYHLIRTVMQALELHDELILEKTDRPGTELVTDSAALPADGRNLAVRAAKEILQICAPEKGVRIRLKKRIPMAAGLAGGSTDAAAVLQGINTLFSLGLDSKALCDIGVRLGADVPFCICGGAALSEGIGEILTPLPSLPDCTVLLAKPDLPVSTAEVYRDFDKEENICHPPVDKQTAALQKGDLDGVIRNMGNVLQPVTAGRHPVISEIQDRLLSWGACGARMSGSGPTVFGIFRDRDAAGKAFDHLKETGLAKDIILTGPASANT